MILISTTNAQFLKDSIATGDNFNKNIFSSSFDKELSTSFFNTRFLYKLNTSKFEIDVNENFRSTIVNGTNISIKDEQSLNFDAYYEIFDDLDVGVKTYNYIYTDDRKLALNKSAKHHNSLLLRYSPFDYLNISPFVGISNNKQITKKDFGYIFGTDFFINNFRTGDLIVNSKFNHQTEDISPRKNSDTQFRVNLKNSIDNDLYNNFILDYSKVRNDFYFEADSITSSNYNITHNIQSRTEEKYSFQDDLNIFTYKNKLNLNLRSGVQYRFIDRNTRYKSLNANSSTFDTEIEEFKLNFQLGTTYRTESNISKFKIAYSEREEKHRPKNLDDISRLIIQRRERLEKQKNNKAQTFTITFLNNYAFSEKDLLTFSLFHRKLIYDTPSDENFDDRDELLTIARIQYDHRFSRNFKMFTNIEANINHIVYIYSERSSNNNIRRNLKLSFGSVLSSSFIRSTNSAEVSSNYTVYDFEDLNPNYQSFSFRQVTIKDSTFINLKKRIKMTFRGRIKLSEQGGLLWKKFRTNPERFISEIYLEPKLLYKHQNISLGFGVRYFNLTTFKFNDNNVKEKVSKYESIGPVSEIRIRMNRRLFVDLYGWYDFVKNNKRKSEIANLSLELNYHL